MSVILVLQRESPHHSWATKSLCLPSPKRGEGKGETGQESMTRCAFLKARQIPGGVMVLVDPLLMKCSDKEDRALLWPWPSVSLWTDMTHLRSHTQDATTTARAEWLGWGLRICPDPCSVTCKLPVLGKAVNMYKPWFPRKQQRTCHSVGHKMKIAYRNYAENKCCIQKNLRLQAHT